MQQMGFIEAGVLLYIGADNELMCKTVRGEAEVKCDSMQRVLREARGQVSWLTAKARTCGWQVPLVKHIPCDRNWHADAMSKRARDAG